MKLEHLAPYLPYGLKSYTLYDGHVLVRDITVNNVMAFVDGDINSKPILRPLSDLAKEIEHNGEKFVPSKEYSYLRFEEISNYKGGENVMNFIQVREQNVLLELHFDVFGLIEKGEAIDINTL